jgi:hypothetical protein
VSSTSTVISAGIYPATNLNQIDTNLVAQNISTNITIFGVAGSYETNVVSLSKVPITGQTFSFATGDDGDLELGVAWPNPRFTIQANTNCVLDNLTGLIWARNTSLFAATNWGSSVTNCNNLNYGGCTDWILPNLRELESLFCQRYNTPALCNTVGDAKHVSNDPFVGIKTAGDRFFWTSTIYGTTPSSMAWFINPDNGNWSNGAKSLTSIFIWPCRGP